VRFFICDITHSNGSFSKLGKEGIKKRLQRGYIHLLEEFERLKSGGVKLSSLILEKLAKLVTTNSPNRFNRNYKDPKDGSLIIDKVRS
jgi:hypothetical protein